MFKISLNTFQIPLFIENNNLRNMEMFKVSTINVLFK